MIPTVQDADTVVLVGKYGSGKSEIALNLAHWCKARGEAVTMIDLDVVTPAFRLRDMSEELEAEGIAVIAPEGQARKSDLPAVDRRVAAQLTKPDERVIIDVGGDEAGLSVLGRFRQGLTSACVCVVANPHRQTYSLARVRNLLAKLQRVLGRAPAGFILNPNLGAGSDVEALLEGLAAADELTQGTGMPLLATTYWEKLTLPEGLEGGPFVPLKRYLGMPGEN